MLFLTVKTNYYLPWQNEIYKSKISEKPLKQLSNHNAILSRAVNSIWLSRLVRKKMQKIPKKSLVCTKLRVEKNNASKPTFSDYVDRRTDFTTWTWCWSSSWFVFLTTRKRSESAPCLVLQHQGRSWLELLELTNCGLPCCHIAHYDQENLNQKCE